MLDPRIYRTGLVVVVLAGLVLAFSLGNQSAPLSSSLAPDAFNGQNVYASMTRMAAGDPVRRPGSDGDFALAAQVAKSFRQYGQKSGFTVSTDTFSGRTADGERTLENVIAVRPGMESGSVVIVAHRDARGSPATASLSGTATLLELARDLAGETLRRTVVLASTSGSQGGAGAIRLASTLAGPIDAVIVLGDLAGQSVHQPIVVPWSDRQLLAPPVLRNTVAAALSQQASMGLRGTSVFGQFVHLAFPLTLSEQAPFGARGVPAVLLSLSGERGPAPGEPIAGADQLNSLGRAVLATISALDGGPTVPADSAYVLFDNKVVPGWAISLFVLALIVPVLLTTIDGLARARRRGHAVWRWLVLVLAAAVPFVLGVLVVLGARLTGAIAIAPPGPVPAGSVPLPSSGIAVLVVAVIVALGSFLLLRPLAIRFATGRSRGRSHAAPGSSDGAVAALLLVLCAVAFATWISNPFAAALLLPALHLWLLAVNPDLRLRLPVRLLLLLLGLIPPALVVVYYAVTLGFTPLQAAWAATLLIAGHAVSLLAALEWAIFLGCVVTAAGILVALSRQPREQAAPVTVRGPVGYAGPGSLGGTESALRR
jgi:Peptidase family M28